MNTKRIVLSINSEVEKRFDMFGQYGWVSEASYTYEMPPQISMHASAHIERVLHIWMTPPGVCPFDRIQRLKLYDGELLGKVALLTDLTGDSIRTALVLKGENPKGSLATMIILKLSRRDKTRVIEDCTAATVLMTE